MAMSPVIVSLAIIVVVLGFDSWVYLDARHHAERDVPVVFEAGSLVIDTPAMWFAACLILWVIFFPLYLTNRA
jgi:hypothetical protein